MWEWFGGAAAQKKRDAPKNAILMLRQQQNMLQKRETHMESLMAEQDALARKNLSTNRTAAKAALVRKKHYERTLEQTSAHLAQIEQQAFSIEAANINQETLNAMKNAGAVMKQIHGSLSIDKVDATMDELRENHALAEDIANAITNAPIGEPLDETALEDELEAMEQEALDERMLKTGTTPAQELPAAPDEQIKGRAEAEEEDEEEEEEEELRKLQAEMAM